MNNGRRYNIEIKQKTKILRKKGLTHREIAKKIGISSSTACSWTKRIILTEIQKKAINERRNKGCFIISSMLTKKEREERRKRAIKYLAPYQFKNKYTKKILISKIVDFYKKNGRIPLKREFNMYGEYKKWVGGWNYAIKLAGFEPNQVIFSKKFTAKDGHICDSFAEKIIDDWLDKNKIKHERNYPYSGGKMTADFAVNDIRIEYFGLYGLNKNYDRIIKIKQKLCDREKIKLIEIYPSDLFSKNFKNCLGNIIKKIRN